MLVTRENLKDLKIGQQIFKAHSGFRMIIRTIYMGIQDVHPNSGGWLKHCFFSPTQNESFSFSANLTNVDKSNLPEELRWESLYTTYEEACVKSRENAIHLIEHYNAHDFKNNPIIVK